MLHVGWKWFVELFCYLNEKKVNDLKSVWAKRIYIFIFFIFFRSVNEAKNENIFTVLWVSVYGENRNTQILPFKVW